MIFLPLEVDSIGVEDWNPGSRLGTKMACLEEHFSHGPCIGPAQSWGFSTHGPCSLSQGGCGGRSLPSFLRTWEKDLLAQEGNLFPRKS